MARVAQIGAIETNTAYNRTVSKHHRIVTAAWGTADSFQLGEEAPQPKQVAILEVEPGLSAASYCLADKCAMWRWEDSRREVGYCGLAGKPAN